MAEESPAGGVEPPEAVVLDESKPMEERVEAAKRLAEMYYAGELVELPTFLAPFVRMPLKTLETILEKRMWASPLEEAVIRGLYEYHKEAVKQRLESASLGEVARVLLQPSSKLEAQIAKKILEERKEDVELLRLAAQAMEAEFLSKNVPLVTDPTRLRYLSQAQIENIIRPSKYVAKDAFRNGLWNLAWGDPEEYGITVEREVHYVSKPQNMDFARLVFMRGIWLERWGPPESYGIKLA